MAIRTKAQPYRLDWQKAKSIEDANAKLQKLWIASDTMFEILFKELRRVGAAIDEAVAGATGATGATGAAGASGSNQTIMVGSFSADYADTSGWADGEMWWPPGGSASGGGSSSSSGYWAPLTDGNIIETDLVFANGDAIMVFVPTP